DIASRPHPGPGHPRSARNRASCGQALRHVGQCDWEPDRKALPSRSDRVPVLPLRAPVALSAGRPRGAGGEVNPRPGDLLWGRHRGNAGHDLGSADHGPDRVTRSRSSTPRHTLGDWRAPPGAHHVVVLHTVRLFPAPELGNASFLVADPDAGVAAVIDPFRDVDGYLSHADKQNLRLTRALDTHLHNDFVSGARELAALSGTEIGPVAPDVDVELGGLTLRAPHTPGHTPDHKSYLLLEGGRALALFSG